MNEKRGPWYLLTGVLIGIGIGVWLGWSFAPVQYTDTFPPTLRSDFKDQYRYMIAAAYSVTGNLERARARLGIMEDGDSVKALGDQAQRMLASNISQDVVSSLGNLSQALQQGNPDPATATSAPPSPQPVSPSTETATIPPAPSASLTMTETPAPGITPSPQATSTSLPAPVDTAIPRPTHPPSPTPGAPFKVDSQSTFCEPTEPGLLQVSLQDSSGKPVAGAELVITWLGGEEHFFTGLKPELGNGYADFVMTSGVEYALSTNDGGTRVTGLVPQACTAADGSAYPGGIRLEFKQP